MQTLAKLMAGGLCALLAQGNLWAQGFLDVAHDPRIPALEQVVGHASGAEITTPDEALAYFRALASAAPDRMRIVSYAETWEGRELVYGIIAAPAVLAEIDLHQASLARLGSGRGLSEAERQSLVAATPAVVWLGYGVHGDEISSTDAALALAYHLLAAQGDETVDAILRNTIVIIDPMQNPDGRNRFVQSFEAARGLEIQGDRFAAEHDQPWPRGRSNHYLFDMNRDWFTLSQPETRGRVRAMQEWHPVVAVDAHEMGGDETYFFAPSAEPFNPYVTSAQREKQDLIGRNHARWFDRFGIEYFTREVYDAFYPGYGDMWPQLNGAIAMTYEQGSARGLVYDRTDGRQLTYRDGVMAHFLSTLSTAEVVARNKNAFLGDYARFRAAAIADNQTANDRYIAFDLSQNRWQAERLARQLVAQGIAVTRLAGPQAVCGREMPAGALVVDTAQPAGRLIETLLRPETPLAEAFAAEQESRRARGLDWQLYDVTAWSLPLMAGVGTATCRQVSLGAASEVSEDEGIAPIIAAGDAAFGYAVPWTDAGQAKLVLAALRAGHSGKTSGEPFTMNGRVFPRGSVIFSTAANPGDLAGTLQALAAEIGAEIVPLASGWTDAGPNLGSAGFRPLKAPRVAMAWGEGTSSTDVGAARYILEQEFGLPVTPIRTGSLAYADLSLYDVLILPDMAGFEGAGGGAAAGPIADYAAGGGVVIGFADAIDYLAGEEVGLLSTAREAAWIDPEAETEVAEAGEGGLAPGTRLQSEDEYKALVAIGEEMPDSVPGVLLRAEADPDHWLSAGYEEAIALLTGPEIYTPLPASSGRNVFRFKGSDALLASGYLWEENRAQLAFKPFVMAEPSGRGIVIGFTESPVTRAYLDGLNLLLLNAVLLGPAHTD